jgi:outer membrane biosynthesis protein TonB
MSASQTAKRRRISVATRERVSPAGPAASVLLHAALIAAFLFTWQHKLDITDETPPIVPVDLITVGDKTNVEAMEKATPKTAPEQKPETPSPPTQEPKPAPEQAEAAPDIAPTKTVLPKEAPTPPLPTTAPKVRPEPPPDKSFDALLNQLTAPDKSQGKVKTGNRTVKGIGAQTAMTMDLVDSLRNQIEQCWNPPTGAPHPEQLVVFMSLSLNQNGTVAQTPQVTGDSAGTHDSYTRAAADAAMRAIYVCAPYKLPPDRYADWKDSTIKFDPRDLGQ